MTGTQDDSTRPEPSTRSLQEGRHAAGPLATLVLSAPDKVPRRDKWNIRSNLPIAPVL